MLNPLPVAPWAAAGEAIIISAMQTIPIRKTFATVFVSFN
jgi:hypothetical protein